MTIHITPETQAAFQTYLNEAVDWHIDGKPILRRDTYPYTLGLGEVTFTAGYQAAQAAQPAQPCNNCHGDGIDGEDSDGINSAVTWARTDCNGTGFIKAAQPAQVPEGYKLVPIEPTKEMWGELARDIVGWLYSVQAPHHGSKLHRHLRMLGREIPVWFCQDIPDMDHTPAKGDFAVAIYKAMIEAAPEIKP